MSNKIFKSTVLVSVISILAAFLLTLAVIYNYFSNEYETMLQNEARSLTEALNLVGDKNYDSFESQHRITIVDKDGTVIYDNEADPKEMDNHKDREEISEALKTGYGYATRNSSTLSERTINIAYRLNNGQVLRVSASHNTALSLLKDILLPIIAIAICAIVISFILARNMANSITKPINEIDLSNPNTDHVYEELTPLVKRISAQNEQIANQMNELKEEHKKQDAMRRDFTANVSHELKTPLTSISGYAELIETGIAKPEDIPTFAAKIHDESQRLITLVGDIIKLSQLDENKIPIKIEDIDLYDTCTFVLTHLEKAIADNNIHVTLSGEHLKIQGAYQIVEEMIYNLIDNAIKYNKYGGSIDITLNQYADGIELAISDTGIGISEEDLEHIFERFYRADKSHSKEIGGTGLGLSIVKHAASAINAKIEIESHLHFGTKIKVLF